MTNLLDLLLVKQRIDHLDSLNSGWASQAIYNALSWFKATAGKPCKTNQYSALLRSLQYQLTSTDSILILLVEKYAGGVRPGCKLNAEKLIALVSQVENLWSIFSSFHYLEVWVIEIGES